MPRELWRVFPWDERASPGETFSPSFIPSSTGRGRFDLSRDRSSVLYLAESPDHAVGESLQPWRGRRIGERHLTRAGLRLSLVAVSIDDDAAAALADLCDPKLLAETGLPPDHLASRRRWVTQPLATSLWDQGYPGLRWWSGFRGDWHTVVLFLARIGDRLAFGEPAPLALGSPAVTEAARLLGIDLEPEGST